MTGILGASAQHGDSPPCPVVEGKLCAAAKMDAPVLEDTRRCRH